MSSANAILKCVRAHAMISKHVLLNIKFQEILMGNSKPATLKRNVITRLLDGKRELRAISTFPIVIVHISLK